MPTGPKPKEKSPKATEKSTREPLMKANSVTREESETKSKAGRVRHADTMPVYKVRAREMSPLSRRATMFTPSDDDLDAGLHETGDDKEEAPVERPKSVGYFNPNPWKIPLKVDDPPYITNLTDDYPRDEYTMMPMVETAPKFYNGKFAPRLYRKDIEEKEQGKVDTKKKMRKPKLPKEVIKREMSKDPSRDERPMLFKPRHIADVQKQKKFGEEVMGKSEVSLHLCDDLTSFMFQHSLNASPNVNPAASAGVNAERRDTRRQLLEMSDSILTSHPDTRSTTSSNWSSMKFPRDRVAQSLHLMTKPDVYPAIRGKEYGIGSGQTVA